MDVSITPNLPAPEWDELVNTSDDAWLYHTRVWIEMVAGLYGVEVICVTIRHNNQVVGGFPLHVARASPYSADCPRASSLHMGSAGPLVARMVSAPLRETICHELTQAVVAWAHDQGIHILSSALPPLAASNLGNARGVNPLVPAGWLDTSTHTRITKLTSEAELWSQLAYDARRSVRRARDAGYTVTREPWPDMLDEYYRVHVETYHRTGVRPHPRAYFAGIATTIAKDGHAVLWVGRDASNHPVAFHNCARFRDGSLYWTGCCETSHLPSGVNYLLFWHALAGAQEDGCGWYETGEAFPNTDDSKLKGLTLFKAKFGGELYRYYRGEIRLCDCASTSLRSRARHWIRRHLGALIHSGRSSRTDAT